MNTAPVATRQVPNARDGDVVRSALLVPVLLLVTATGSQLSLIALSNHVFDRTGSGLASGTVLIAPWLLALLLPFLLTQLLTVRRPSRLLIMSEGIGLIMTLGVVLIPLDTVVGLALAWGILVARGFFDSITRTATTVLLRMRVPDTALSRVNTLAEIGKLTGMSLGSVLVGLSADVVSLRMVFVLNAAAFVVSMVLAMALPMTEPPAQSGTASTDARPGRIGRLLATNREVRWLFALFGLTALWQGYHSVAVNTIPITLLNGGTPLVGTFVSLCGVAIFAGSFAAITVNRFCARWPLQIWLIIPVLLLLTAVGMARTFPTIIAYLGFMMTFEIAYIICNNRLLVSAPVSQVGAIVTLRQTVLPAGVIAAIGLTGIISDRAGPIAAAVCVAALSLVVTIVSIVSRAVQRPDTNKKFETQALEEAN